MSKAKAHVATPAVSINSIEAANKIVQLINSRPTTPSVVEIARVLDEHGPAVVEFPALLDWRRRQAENKAVWEAAGPDVDEAISDTFDAALHAHSAELMRRPVMSWEDVAVIGDIAMYWIYGGDVVFGESLRHDLRVRAEGYDTQVVAHLLNGIARLTGGRHV